MGTTKNRKENWKIPRLFHSTKQPDNSILRSSCGGELQFHLEWILKTLFDFLETPACWYPWFIAILIAANGFIGILSQSRQIVVMIKTDFTACLAMRWVGELRSFFTPRGFVSLVSSSQLPSFPHQAQMRKDESNFAEKMRKRRPSGRKDADQRNGSFHLLFPD